MPAGQGCDAHRPGRVANDAVGQDVVRHGFPWVETNEDSQGRHFFARLLGGTLYGTDRYAAKDDTADTASVNGSSASAGSSVGRLVQATC
jgi:hypothetical protein